VTELSNLSVRLINNRDIIVTSPEAGFSVTYRKDGEAPLLIAVDGIDRGDDPPKVKFWAQAWRAAHQESSCIGLVGFLGSGWC
jgi:hypothetical protein